MPERKTSEWKERRASRGVVFYGRIEGQDKPAIPLVCFFPVSYIPLQVIEWRKMKKKTKPAKEVCVAFWTTRKEKTRLESEAMRDRVSLSEFIRRKTLES